MLVLALGGGGGYIWHSQQQVDSAAAAAQSAFDTAVDDACQGEPDVQLAAAVPLDAEEQSPGLAAGAAAAVSAVGAAAAGAIAAGVSEAAAFTGRVITPRAKVRAQCGLGSRVLCGSCTVGSLVELSAV